MLASILCLLLQQAQQDDCSDWSNGKRVNYLSDLLWLYVDTEETSRFKAIPFLLYCFCHVCPQDQIIHKVTHDLKKKKRKKRQCGFGPHKKQRRCYPCFSFKAVYSSWYLLADLQYLSLLSHGESARLLPQSPLSWLLNETSGVISNGGYSISIRFAWSHIHYNAFYSQRASPNCLLTHLDWTLCSERNLGQKFDVYMLLSWFLIRLCPWMNVYVTHAAYM